jgi:hypothetical protein
MATTAQKQNVQTGISIQKPLPLFQAKLTVNSLGDKYEQNTSILLCGKRCCGRGDSEGHFNEPRRRFPRLCGQYQKSRRHLGLLCSHANTYAFLTDSL